jgi:hypothetical protein
MLRNWVHPEQPLLVDPLRVPSLSERVRALEDQSGAE